MNGVAYGATFVSAGDSGVLFSSSDGSTWTPATTNPALGVTDLHAVNYDATLGEYLVAGSGGVILESSDAATWSKLISSTTTTASNLNAITSGSGYIVAVGDNGTIISSTDGATWTSRSSSGQTLYGVTYGYDYTNSRYVFVAVGASRTLLYSIDYGTTWSASTCSLCTGTPDLKGVTYGYTAGTSLNAFVAVGTGGAVLTSPDGITWTQQTSLTGNLNAVAYTSYRRFVAVGDGGNIYYSEYTDAGATWSQATSPTTSSLYAVSAGGLYDFSAVGASGINLYAD